jgi:hypothetical protein
MRRRELIPIVSAMNCEQNNTSMVRRGRTLLFFIPAQ